MLIASIIIASIVLAVHVTVFVLYKKPNKISYDLKTGSAKFYWVSGTIVFLLSIGSLAASAILSVVDKYGATQLHLFVLGCISGLYGVIQFPFVARSFLGIKGDTVYTRRLFKTKEAKISDIKTIRRGIMDILIVYKDGYKFSLVGYIDPIIEMIEKRKDPELFIENFIDTRYFWNNPKRMKFNKGFSIFFFVWSIAIMALSPIAGAFQRPVREEDTVLVTGEFEEIRPADTVTFLFYLKDDDTEYQMLHEVTNYFDLSISSHLHEGDTITFRVENRQNLKPRLNGYAKADIICGVEYDSKQYLTYEGYCQGILDKRSKAVFSFSFALSGLFVSVILFSQTTFIAKLKKDIESKKNK